MKRSYCSILLINQSIAEEREDYLKAVVSSCKLVSHQSGSFYLKLNQCLISNLIRSGLSKDDYSTVNGDGISIRLDQIRLDSLDNNGAPSK